MDIKIGETSFKTRKPSDLDGVLVATTGCDAAETAQQLAGWPSPGRIASALRPFLPADAPSTPEIAQSIGAAVDGPDILVAVKKLYAGAAPTVPAVSAEGAES